MGRPLSRQKQLLSPKILRPPKIRREYLRLVTTHRKSIIRQLRKNFLAKSSSGSVIQCQVNYHGDLAAVLCTELQFVGL